MRRLVARPRQVFRRPFSAVFERVGSGRFNGNRKRSVRNFETGGWDTSKERRLYVSSLEVDAKRAYEATRGHWEVESMHWSLDVTYGEDYSRARTKHAAANRATVRRMAASLTIPWARRRGFTIKEAMMFTCLSKEARLEMLTA